MNLRDARVANGGALQTPARPNLAEKKSGESGRIIVDIKGERGGQRERLMSEICMRETYAPLISPPIQILCIASVYQILRNASEFHILRNAILIPILRNASRIQILRNASLIQILRNSSRIQIAMRSHPTTNPRFRFLRV